MRALIAPAALTLVCAIPASADPLLQKARASTDADGPLYAYEVDYFDGDVRTVGKIDPGQPEGSRISVYSPDESEWDEDFREMIESMDEGVDGDIFCDDFAAQIPDDAKRSGETEDGVRYAFTPLADADADGMERKVMKRMTASAVLSKEDGQVLSMQMSLPKPYKPSIVAKIETFTLDVSCARTPDGRTYLQDMQMKVSGSAMMQSFDQTVSRRITKLLEPVTRP
ncbi:hypothetical protein WNY37_03560 [Henriciella sp. AS95]|uniref:hypothetical protein n=1 Tax=Henriciella sp. AS95 TaxID=3135782 RepID=UPI00316FD356